MLKMRPSRVLSKLRADEVVCCFKLNLGESSPVEIAGLAGYDCVWLCMEHVPTDWDVLDKQILAAKAHGIDSVVRVARGPYSNHILPLELDAAGIMVPHVMSEADCRDVVRMTRFHPIGRRPVDSGNQDGLYCQIPITDYMEQANRERFVCVQIEDPEPMEELEAICALDGVDIIFFGPGDFSQGAGIPGQWDHPKLIDARKRVAEVARAHGKFAGTTTTPEALEERLAEGYRFLCMGADVLAIGAYCNQMVDRFRTAARKAGLNWTETDGPNAGSVSGMI